MYVKLLKKLRKEFYISPTTEGWRVQNKKTNKTMYYPEAAIFIYTWASDNMGFLEFNRQYEKMIKRGRVEFRLF